MKFLHHDTKKTSQWQIYKELELIPSSAIEPQANQITFAFGVDQVWRLLIVALTRELVYEQQIEYLERCWTLDYFEPDTATNSNTWHKLWTLMN